MADGQNDRIASPPAAAGGDPVARLEQLRVAFEGRRGLVQAVRGVDLNISRGEIVALVGESGSGKTTAAQALLGLLSEGPTRPRLSGVAEVAGVDMLGESSAERRELRRRSLGAVFQDPTASLNPTMTLGRQLREVAESDEAAITLLDSVGVPEARLRLKSYPHEISGGQRQRVMIAMAIAGDPALVVADEPTTALDVTIQAQILQLIGRLRNEIGCAFLLVTHDLGVAAQIADRIAVCYAGRIVELGPTDEILTRPSHPYSSGLMKSRITLRTERRKILSTLAGEPPDLVSPPPGCPFAPRCEFRVDACEAALPPLSPVAGRAQESACIRADELLERLAVPEILGLDESASAAMAAEPAAALAAAAAAEPAAPEATPREGELALKISDLRKSYRIRGGGKGKSVSVLRGLNLEVSSRECVALVGESGCGKSTLLQIISGLTQPDSGELQINAEGQPQMIFQDAGGSLTPWMTVGEQLRERLQGAGVKGAEAKQRMQAALARVGLTEDVAASRPHQLSGGQRQRVAIARAIVVPPPVLLCDEPTSALDVSLAAKVLNLLGELREELGMTLIFVTHDLAVARFVADRVAVMHEGTIVEIGPADQVAHNPSHPYSRELLSSIPDVSRALEGERLGQASEVSK